MTTTLLRSNTITDFVDIWTRIRTISMSWVLQCRVRLWTKLSSVWRVPSNRRPGRWCRNFVQETEWPITKSDIGARCSGEEHYVVCACSLSRGLFQMSAFFFSQCACARMPFHSVPLTRVGCFRRQLRSGTQAEGRAEAARGESEAQGGTRAVRAWTNLSAQERRG